MPLDLSLPFQPRNPLPDNSAFGPRKLYNDFHWGVDFNGYTNAWAGATIRAVGNGIITQKGGSQLDVRGYWVVLDHGKDAKGDRWSTRYHILPKPYEGWVGQKITRGDKLGVVGVSGSSATGPHLHFELLRNGIRVDPMEYLTYVGPPTPNNAPTSGGATEFENDMPLSNEDIEKVAKRTAQIIWNETKVNRSSGSVSAIQELADAKSAAYDIRTAVEAVPAKVWAETVSRHSGPVSVRQELADAKTFAMRSLGLAEDAVTAATPEIDYDKLAASIVSRLPENNAATKADLAEVLKSISFKAE